MTMKQGEKTTKDVNTSIHVHGNAANSRVSTWEPRISLEILHDEPKHPRRVLAVIFRVDAADGSMFAEIESSDVMSIVRGVGVTHQYVYKAAPFDFLAMQSYYHERKEA